MKKLTLLIILLCDLVSAVAQSSQTPYFLVTHAGAGYGFFPGLVADMTTGHSIAAGGINGRYDFAEKWSLLVGLDYQFWYFKGYSFPDGIPHPYTASGHAVRLPIRLEYHKRWFYMAFGPYLEKTFGDISEGNPNEIATIGPTLEMGGRIRLSENDRLRIGLQTSVGATLYRYSKGVDIGRIEASCLYEHWF